jgi:transposase
MEMDGEVTLMAKELERLRVVIAVDAGEISRETAAMQLGISSRQLKRLLQRFRQDGPAGLRSRRRGQPSNRRLRTEVRQQALNRARTRYIGFGPTLLQEKLVVDDGLVLSVESVRQLLIEAGLWHARRRRREVHPPRERRPRFGELIQVDGSLHDWFEGRAARCTLLAFIDDATGLITAARFAPTETTAGYFIVLGDHLRTYGRPISLYSDRHSIFRVNDRKGQEIDGETQLERALKALEIEGICAHSPQAKGRIERLFQTCQDRLVKEMRLRGIDSMEAANDYLPHFIAFFNERFVVEPSSPDDAHRPVLQSARTLELILAEQTTRTLSKNLTFKYRRQLYQVQADQRRRRLAGQRIAVCACSDGEIVVLNEDQELPYSLGPRKSPAVPVVDDKTLNAQVDAAVIRRPNITRPSSDHPWKRGLRARQPVAA